MDFATVYPGGEKFSQHFAGAECLWDFWRFHRPEEHGRPLLVGRTRDIGNSYGYRTSQVQKTGATGR